MSYVVVLELVIIASATAGFFISYYIRHVKKMSERMVCPLDFDCAPVIYSEYSKFLGMPIELLGMAYYALVGASYLVLLAFPVLAPSLFIFAVLTLSLAAFLFSAYLTFVQAFTLKQWCSWCLLSAFLCTTIFFSALFASEFGFLALLADNHYMLMALYAFGFALGLGGATIANLFFFKFLKDFKISESESEILHVLSDVVWFALAVMVVSEIGLYLPEADALHTNSVFLVKSIAIGILIVTGVCLNLLVVPRLIKISFHQKHAHEEGELRRTRKIAFVLGALSITSWYAVFVLEMLPHVPNLRFLTLFLFYLAVLGIAVAGSLAIERTFTTRAAKEITKNNEH